MRDALERVARGVRGEQLGDVALEAGRDLREQPREGVARGARRVHLRLERALRVRREGPGRRVDEEAARAGGDGQRAPVAEDDVEVGEVAVQAAVRWRGVQR